MRNLELSTLKACFPVESSPMCVCVCPKAVYCYSLDKFTLAGGKLPSCIKAWLMIVMNLGCGEKGYEYPFLG